MHFSDTFLDVEAYVDLLVLAEFDDGDAESHVVVDARLVGYGQHWPEHGLFGFVLHDSIFVDWAYVQGSDLGLIELYLLDIRVGIAFVELEVNFADLALRLGAVALPGIEVFID